MTGLPARLEHAQHEPVTSDMPTDAGKRVKETAA